MHCRPKQLIYGEMGGHYGVRQDAATVVQEAGTI